MGIADTSNLVAVLKLLKYLTGDETVVMSTVAKAHTRNQSDGANIVGIPKCMSGIDEEYITGRRTGTGIAIAEATTIHQ